MVKKLLVGSLVLLGVIIFLQHKSDAPSVRQSPKPTTATKAQAFNKQQYSLTDPNSPWVVVNKKTPLVPQNYAPADLVDSGVQARVAGTQVRQIVSSSLGKLFADASANGTPLRLSSGYRSYVYQVGLYNGYVAKEGQEAADAQSARPGFSEHQTGLAVDVAPVNGLCEVELCFADTPAGKWLAANAYKYGFIIRYDNGLTNTTGYAYEPWHLRYVGTELAQEMQRKGVKTLEQFFNLAAAPTY